MINVYKHASFTRLISSRIKTATSTMVLVMGNLSFGTIIIQITFAIDITNRTSSSRNMSGNYKTKEFAVCALTYRHRSRRYDLCITEKQEVIRETY